MFSIEPARCEEFIKFEFDLLPKNDLLKKVMYLDSKRGLFSFDTSYKTNIPGEKLIGEY